MSNRTVDCVVTVHEQLRSDTVKRVLPSPSLRLVIERPEFLLHWAWRVIEKSLAVKLTARSFLACRWSSGARTQHGS